MSHLVSPVPAGSSRRQPNKCHARIVIGCVATNLLSRQHTILEGSVRTWAVVAWVSSVIVQVCGSLLIGWRAWSTPTTVVSNGRQGFNPWTIVWTLVDSGTWIWPQAHLSIRVDRYVQVPCIRSRRYLCLRFGSTTLEHSTCSWRFSGKLPHSCR